MVKKYAALYIKGRSIPFGAMRTEIAEEVIKDLKTELGGSYELRPITKVESRQINKDIFGGYEGLENLIQRYNKK